MASAQITLVPRDDAPVVARDLYSHFAEHLGRCIYEGLWVGEDSDIPNVRGIRKDVVAALRKLKMGVLRWPGGCFADEYHWKDGVGPREQRPSIYNSHWGGVVENNHFGTHEFFDLCEQLGCDAYVSGNVGSGSVQEMAQWVEYITSPNESPMANWRRQNGRDEPWKLKYFGVGNESWGCGGNMRPEYYADLYRRYNTFVKNYRQGEFRVKRIACGPNSGDENWTRVVMENAWEHMDGLGLHYYTILDSTWPPRGNAAKFTEEEYQSTLKGCLYIEELIKRHLKIMDEIDKEKRVDLVVDEWGTWHAVEEGTNPGFLYQQNAMRDALVASLTFDIFHKYCDRITLANIAQMVNVLQAMVLTDREKMIVTPTYWVFEMYAAHHDGQLVDLTVEGDQYGELPGVSATATRRDGRLSVGVSCLDAKVGRKVSVCGIPSGLKVERARILAGAGMDSHNTFDQPDAVAPKDVEVRVANGTVDLDMPPASVAVIELA